MTDSSIGSSHDFDDMAPKLVGSRHRSNIVFSKGEYFGVPQSIGLVDFFKPEERAHPARVVEAKDRNSARQVVVSIPENDSTVLLSVIAYIRFHSDFAACPRDIVLIV